MLIRDTFQFGMGVDYREKFVFFLFFFYIRETTFAFTLIQSNKVCLDASLQMSLRSTRN